MSATSTVARSLAALLGAGLPVSTAMQQLDEQIRQLGQQEREFLVARVNLAVELGMPMATTLRDWAWRSERLEAAERELQAAFAAPGSTAKLIAWLPLLSLLVAQLAGLNPIAALATNPIAQVSAGFGALLLAAGWFTMRRMIERRKPSSRDEAELLDLFAECLQSGLSTGECLARARQFLVENGREIDAQDWQSTESQRLADFAFTHGVRLAELLRATAQNRRDQVRAGERSAIERLSVRLMVPLGLVVLPAFVLIGVMPVAIGMFGQARTS